MLRLRTLSWVPGAILASLLLAAPTRASILQDLDLDELVGEAEQILLGEVVFTESFHRPNGNLGTWHRSVIEQDLGGGAAEEREVIVETSGGHLGDLAMRVEGEPSFTVGERVVVFVRDGGAYSAFRPVGMGQGVMRVRTEQGVETVTQTREGMMLMRRNARGLLEKSRGALPDRERLDTFLSRVRSLVEQRAGGDHE